MAANVIKTRADANAKQKLFLTALESYECSKLPRADRWRWCAQQAGYPDNVPISDILAPIQHLIKEVSESILIRASVEAAWTLSDAAGDGLIDAQTKDRLNAAKDIMDRTVPKKTEDTGRNSQPVALLILPAKQEQIKLVEGTVAKDLLTINQD